MILKIPIIEIKKIKIKFKDFEYSKKIKTITSIYEINNILNKFNISIIV